MINAVRTSNFTKGATKTVITAAGMTGTTIGAYHAMNLVSEATDNAILGFAARITTILVGALVVNKINNSVDKAFDVKALPTSQPLIFEAAPDVAAHVGVVPDIFGFDLGDGEEGVI